LKIHKSKPFYKNRTDAYFFDLIFLDYVKERVKQPNREFFLIF